MLDAIPHSADIQSTAALLARSLSVLVLRLPLADPSESAVIPPSASATIRSRLVLAEEGCWFQLLSAAHTELRLFLPHLPDICSSASAPSFEKRVDTAIQRTAGKCYHAAAQALLAPPPLPPCDATLAKTLALFQTAPATPSPLDPPFSSILSSAVALASRAAWPSRRSILHRVHLLRAGAFPGPSGTRNHYLQCMLLSPLGADVLSAWVYAWTLNALPPPHSRRLA